MPNRIPSANLPTSMGWYVVWRKDAFGAYTRALYFCVETGTSEMACMSARPADNEDFMPVSHNCFVGVLWQGPFKVREEANEYLHHPIKNPSDFR